MNRYEMFEIIIDSNSVNYENNKEFIELSNFMNKIDWINDIQTFAYEVHFYPTHNLISNEFSFENRNDDSYSRDGKIPYDKFLSTEDIKSLSYFDYVGEKLYRLPIQDKPISDWDYINAENLNLITKKLIDYLKVNNLTEFHDETLIELEKLNIISKFCKNKNYELILKVEF